MLEIRDLKCRIGDTEILRGVTLSVSAGEVHAIMGPNAPEKARWHWSLQDMRTMS